MRLETKTVVLLLALVVAPAAKAYQFEDAPRLDHRDQWGFRLEMGATWLAATNLRGMGGSALAGMLEAGVSRGLPRTGHEVSGRVRPLFAPDSVGVMLLGGYRAYAGMEHWKTFADLDLVVPLSPGPAGGLRLGLGVMLDPSRSFGLSLSGGAFAAMGGAFVSGFDLSVGFQLRFD